MKTQSTHKREFWLSHIRQAKEEKLSFAAYAKQHSLSDKAMYRWNKVLTQRGLLMPGKPQVSFAKITPAVCQSECPFPIEIVLVNGHRIHLPAVTDATLVALVDVLSRQ